MESNKKLNLFNRIKIAIFNLEKYTIFVSENKSIAIKYLLKLIILISICSALLFVYDANKGVNKAIFYIQNELPNFELEDNKIKFENEFIGYDEEYDFNIKYLKQDSLNDEQINEFLKKDKSLVLLNNKINLFVFGFQEEYSYSQIKDIFDIQGNNKQALVDTITNNNLKVTFVSTLFVIECITIFIYNLIDIAICCLTVALFGYLIMVLARIRTKFYINIVLAIYSLTLSIVLDLIYTIISYFTGFQIEYFSTLYIAIAYIYITAAILIIKTDLMNHVMQMKLIEEENRKIQKESLKPKYDEEDNKKDENKEKDNENNDEKKDDLEVPKNEPDGSEI